MENATKNSPSASIVFDRFHVSKHLNDAVDQLHRQEDKSIRELGETTLTGTKKMWLFYPKNLSFNRLIQLTALKQFAFRVGRASGMKNRIQ
jgi:transposase